MSKKYMIIKREGKHLGLFSYVITNLGNINYAIKKNMIPVIDMKTYKNAYLKDDQIGEINAWELYFEQPLNVGLDQITSDETIVFEKIIRNRPNDSMRFFKNNKVNNYWSLLRKKYIRLNEKTRIYIEEEYSRLFSNQRVLGVLCRGTDYVKLEPFRHPVQPTAEEVIEKSKKVMKKYNCEKIFLATEDMSILKKFENEFGDKLIINKSERFNNTDNNFLADIKFDRPNDEYLRGLEYLTTIVLLSRCNCLIGGRASGTIGAVLFSEGFEYTYFWNKGRYGTSKWFYELFRGVDNDD